jgi:energy-coupling factor transport system permease protein
MRVFVWHAGESFLHGLNPLTKLGACFLTAAVVSTASEPITPAIVVLVALLVTRVVGRVPARVIARPMLFGLLASVGVFWTYSLFYGGSGPAWVFGATMAMRLLAIMSASVLFVLTTDPAKFVRSLIHQARVSPRIAYSVFAAYRFVPLLEVEFQTIRAARQMRGGAGRGTPLERGRELFDYAIPLLASAVHKGERVALAMESRGFGALPNRTYFRTTTLGRGDLVFSVACIAVFAALVVSRFYLPEIA